MTKYDTWVAPELAKDWHVNFRRIKCLPEVFHNINADVLDLFSWLSADDEFGGYLE